MESNFNNAEPMVTVENKDYRIDYRKEGNDKYRFVIYVGEDTYQFLCTFDEIICGFSFESFTEKVVSREECLRTLQKIAGDSFPLFQSAKENDHYLYLSMKYLAGIATQEEADELTSIDGKERFVVEDKVYDKGSISFNAFDEFQSYVPRWDLDKNFPKGFMKSNPAYSFGIHLTECYGSSWYGFWSPSQPNRIEVLTYPLDEPSARCFHHIKITDDLVQELIEEISELKHPTPHLLKIVDDVSYHIVYDARNYREFSYKPFAYRLGDNFATFYFENEKRKKALAPEDIAKIIKSRETFAVEWQSILQEDGSYSILHGNGFKIGYHRYKNGGYREVILCVGDSQVYNYGVFSQLTDKFDFFTMQDDMSIERYNEIRSTFADDSYSLYKASTEHGDKYFTYFLKYIAGKATQEEADYCNAIEGGCYRLVPQDRVYGVDDITICDFWYSHDCNGERCYMCITQIGEYEVWAEWRPSCKNQLFIVRPSFEPQYTHDGIVKISKQLVNQFEEYIAPRKGRK